MLMPMLPFLIRLGRASLVFAIAGGVAGLGIAADSPENPAVSLWTHPWGYRGAIAGIVGALLWSPLLTSTRLWGAHQIPQRRQRREVRICRTMAAIFILGAIFWCTSSWLRINDGGSARVEFAQNAEALDDWSILREEEGQETRYLQVQIESVAPLPLVTGTLGPTIPVFRPAARSVVGTLGSAVRDHSLTTAESKAITLKDLLVHLRLLAVLDLSHIPDHNEVFLHVNPCFSFFLGQFVSLPE